MNLNELTLKSLLTRPILITGVGLSVMFGFWETISHSFVPDLGMLSLTLLVGGGVWLLSKNPPKSINKVSPVLNREEIKLAIAKAEKIIAILESEAPEIAINLRLEVNRLPLLLERDRLKIAIAGSSGAGKTTLIERLSAEINDLDLDEMWGEVGSSYDLVLFMIAADLQESEYKKLESFYEKRQYCLLIFNKEDQYLPEERSLILQQLQRKVSSILKFEDVISISCNPNLIKVRKQIGGSWSEEIEKPEPQLTRLTDRLNNLFTEEYEKLILSTTQRLAIEIINKAHQELNLLRKTKALPLIEKYQWMVATSALANPIPTLDLLVTAAINSQMIMDLAKIYNQKFSLEQAQVTAKTISSLIIKLGLVEISTQTISSILKGNVMTYVAGGILQGISAAYWTRIAGLSMIQYCEDQDPLIESSLNLDKFSQVIKKVFTENQQISRVKDFVRQASSIIHA